MTSVLKTFKTYSQLSAEDLDFELSTTRYLGEELVSGSSALVFDIEDPDTMAAILTDRLGDTRMDDRGMYHFPDGTVARYIKCRDRFEFKRYGKVFAILKWRR